MINVFYDKSGVYETNPEFLQEICGIEFPDDWEHVHELVRAMDGPNPEIVSHAYRIRELGGKAFMLTEGSARRRRMYKVGDAEYQWPEVAQPENVFEELFSKSKLDPQTYEQLQSWLEVEDPVSCWLIDDDRLNIEVARSLGWRAHLYIKGEPLPDPSQMLA